MKKEEKIAKTIVDKMYEVFKNPKAQGPKFTWESFPELAKDIAIAYTSSSFYKLTGEKLSQKEKEVGDIVFKLAQEKVNNEIVKKSPTMP